MKIMYLTCNENTMPLYSWLLEREDVYLYKDKFSLDEVIELSPHIIISYNYLYVIKKEIIEYMKGNIINLHISLLPWNRGVSPNIWSFIDNTPKGVTIHYVNEYLDMGDIIAQKELFFDETKETLRSSYDKLHEEIQQLFKENWELIKKTDNIKTISQIDMKGSYHSKKDFEDIKRKIDFSYDDKISDILLKLKLVDK